MENNREMKKYYNTVGIIKEIDNVGRIVILKEFRERLMLEKYVEVVMTPDGVFIRNSKYELVKKRPSIEQKNIIKSGEIRRISTLIHYKQA